MNNVINFMGGRRPDKELLQELENLGKNPLLGPVIPQAIATPPILLDDEIYVASQNIFSPNVKDTESEFSFSDIAASLANSGLSPSNVLFYTDASREEPYIRFPADLRSETPAESGIYVFGRGPRSQKSGDLLSYHKLWSTQTKKPKLKGGFVYFAKATAEDVSFLDIPEVTAKPGLGRISGVMQVRDGNLWIANLDEPPLYVHVDGNNPSTYRLGK